MSVKIKHKQKKLKYGSYDDHEFGTQWWCERAQDRGHQRAYRSIAVYLAQCTGPSSAIKRIIDFACGPGFLIKHVQERFPQAQIIGIDESQLAIDAANEYHRTELSEEQRGKITLEQMPLPNFRSKLKKADVVLFSFPDFRVDSEIKWIKKWRKVFPEDWEESKRVRRKLVKVFPDAEHTPVYDLFIKRIANRNLLSLVKKSGIVVRVEYSACQRSECDECYLEEMAWYEGTKPGLAALNGKRRKRLRLARLISSQFIRSKVIHDVHAQTGNEEDQEGGFFISIFKLTV